MRSPDRHRRARRAPETCGRRVQRAHGRRTGDEAPPRSPVPPSKSHVRALLLAAAVAAAAGALVAAFAASASSANERSPVEVAVHDGLGIRPGRIKHVWLIILENKSYDATFTGLNNNTYLWQTLPSQGVLLKNYYGTGHFSLDNYVAMVSGQATQPDTQADCPQLRRVPGTVDTTGTLCDQPELRPGGLRRRAQRRAGTNGCVYPPTVPTLFNQLDAAGVSWKGYAQDLGNPDASGPDAQRRRAGPAARRTRRPARDRQHHAAQPGRRERDRPVRAQALPVPVVPVDPAVRGLQRRRTSRTCSTRHGLYHDLQSEATTPAFSWISPNNCSDAHDAVCNGNNLSGGFSDPNTPNAAAQLHRRPVRVGPVPRARRPRDRSLAGVQGRRPDRRHLRRGVPAVHLHRQQLRQLDDRRAQRGGLDRVGHGRREPVRQDRAQRADRAEHAAGDRRQRQPALPGPGRQRVRRPPEQLRRADGAAQPAGTCILGGGSHSPGARTDAAARPPANARRSSTTRSSRPTRAAR